MSAHDNISIPSAPRELFDVFVDKDDARRATEHLQEVDASTAILQQLLAAMTQLSIKAELRLQSKQRELWKHLVSKYDLDEKIAYDDDNDDIYVLRRDAETGEVGVTRRSKLREHARTRDQLETTQAEGRA